MEEKENWAQKPTNIRNWPNDVKYVMFLDENNCDDITNIMKKISNNVEVSIDERFFTLTGCICTTADYSKIKTSFNELKEKYWQNGCYINKNGEVEKVCFHSRDIRRKVGPFSPSNLADYESFITDLSFVLTNANCRIISITINIYDYLLKGYKYNLYSTAFDFIIERLIYFMPNDAKAIMMFESRGKNEDKRLHTHVTDLILNTGTKRIPSKELSSKIYGIYFNPKWIAR